MCRTRSTPLLLCALLPFACVSNALGQAATEAAALDTLKNDLVEAGINKLVNANTGASSDLQGIATSLNDLIPDLQFSINGDEVGDESLNALGITYSPRIDAGLDVGLSVLFGTPTVNRAFEEQGLITAEQLAALDNTLSFGDSTEVSLTVSRIGNFLGQRYGRSLGDYRDVMDTLLDIAIAANYDRNRRRQELQDKQAPILIQLGSRCPVTFGQLTEAAQQGDPGEADLEQALQRAIGAELAANPEADGPACEAQGREFIDSYLAIEAESASYVTSLESMLTRMGLFALPELVEQQPQLQFAASYVDNDELVGPNEYSFSASWEIPLGENSVNTLLGSDAWKNCRGAEKQEAADCVMSLQDVLGNSMLQDTPTKSQFRFSLSAEYRRRNDYNVANMDPAFMFSQASENAASIAGSLYLKRFMSERDQEPYVFEATLEYESNDSDTRNDRALLGVTATRNISSGLGLSLGLVWANRPEFRGDVDQELTAKLGLNYKLTPR